MTVKLVDFAACKICFSPRPFLTSAQTSELNDKSNFIKKCWPGGNVLRNVC